MSAKLLLGSDVTAAIKDDLKHKVAQLTFIPRVVFIRVGEDPASVSYVRGKQKMALEIGMQAETRVLDNDISQADLMAEVLQANTDDTVDGILVQLPLPAHLDETPILEAISPEKDVDGFHTTNVGRLWTGQASLLPCTPAGLIQIMDHYELPIQSQHCVIVGRSNIVGKPAAALFLARHATVTLAHSRTRNLAGIISQADIIVAAVGRAGFITSEMVKPGAVCLDVGITRVDGKIKGDIAPEVAQVAQALTPMPGGTGRVTVGMLMLNTYHAAVRRRGHGL